MKKFGGFTLAEVLITLGIIGVVAAMTMPTLINQTNGAQYKAAYKKALSAISQGVTLNVALDDISFADNSAENILPGRMNVVNPTTSAGYTLPSTGLYPEGKAPDTYLFFNDSSMFAFKNAQDGTNCTMSSSTSANNTGCYGFIDVNGAKGPNKVVSCDNGTTAFDTYSAGVKTSADACNVTSPTDIYPVIYYDQTILPVTNAGTAVLYGK